MRQNRPQATDQVDPSGDAPSLSSSSSTVLTPSEIPRQENQITPILEGSAAEGNAVEDDGLELLRDLLFDEYRQQIMMMRNEVTRLQAELDALETQIQDKEALLSTITPVIAGAIRTNINESRDEMIEALTPVIAGAIRTNINESRDEMIDALYPIMGRLVQRSVTEAMRDLVQRIDQQMRRTLNLKAMWKQFKARLRGVSSAEMVMRDALPLDVEQIFLIHKESGLLLLHLSASGKTDDDSDIISGMLTAITEFTEDAFGRREEESLNEIQYGDRSILLEAAHLVYIAIVINGFESSEFRNQMREIMIAIEHRHAAALHHYDGDDSRFEESKAILASLLT